jgi:enoyl-CoA hydratase/carnithine racemase
MKTPQTFETLKLDLAGGVATVELNRPDKANAMSLKMWLEIREAFAWIDAAPQVRVAILRGSGRMFTAGIDLALLGSIREEIADPCEGRMREKLRRMILDLQDSLTAIERCRKPVLAAVHGLCLGGGIDLICACDMRYCSSDAGFSIKEIDVGMTADVGTLQRLPKLIGEGMVRELAYTGRSVSGAEAKEIGLVNHCYGSSGELFANTTKIAEAIAKKSPLSIRGIKEMITYARDHSVADGLNYVATWNAAMLVSEDLAEALTAQQGKCEPNFRD